MYIFKILTIFYDFSNIYLTIWYILYLNENPKNQKLKVFYDKKYEILIKKTFVLINIENNYLVCN